MTYTYIVNPETGEILFDLVHDLITQNIRAIKLIAKKLNAVLRQKRLKTMKTNYENFSREDLIELIGQQKQELIVIGAVKNQYMKHLEKVIEYNSVEAYCKTVQKNREVAKTTSLNNDKN